MKYLSKNLLIIAVGIPGCTDPMYPKPKLDPIVIPAFVHSAPVDRTVLTIVLPTTMSNEKDRSLLGRLPAKSAFNVQWTSLPKNRLRNGKQDDLHYAGLAYYVTIVESNSDGEHVENVFTQQPEREIGVDGLWSYRLAVTAPDGPGRYVVRLFTPDNTISESFLEVFAGETAGN